MDRLVAETIDSLAARGIDAYDLAPLMKLRDAVRALDGVTTSPSQSAQASPAAPAQDQQQAAPAAPPPQPAALGNANPEMLGRYGRDGRRGAVVASDNLLARASAIIDVMVQGGQTAEHACQIITRQLLAVGIKLPESGGDARAWKRLHNWRNNLIHYKRSGRAWDAYCAFKEELADIPPDQRLRVAVGERMWDLRQQDYAGQETA